MEAGFRMLSPTPLVPRGERVRGRMSPGSEMLTLEQFLKEANKEAEVSPSPKENVSSVHPWLLPWMQEWRFLLLKTQTNPSYPFLEISALYDLQEFYLSIPTAENPAQSKIAPFKPNIGQILALHDLQEFCLSIPTAENPTQFKIITFKPNIGQILTLHDMHVCRNSTFVIFAILGCAASFFHNIQM